MEVERLGEPGEKFAERKVAAQGFELGLVQWKKLGLMLEKTAEQVEVLHSKTETAGWVGAEQGQQVMVQKMKEAHWGCKR